MIIISDTTPIISLLKAGRLDLLEKMFGMVLIPNAVYLELTENDSFTEEAETVKTCPFLKVASVSNSEALNILQKVTGLDAGESEAIVLAGEKSADLLFMDEHKGRQVAKKLGIAITGTIGILLQAYDEQYMNVSDVEECLMILKTSGIRISESLYNLVRQHIYNSQR